MGPPDRRLHLERLARVPPLGWWGMVVLNHHGFRCGYVNLPDGHPWIGLHLEDVPAHVHGGVTFNSQYDASWLANGDGVPEGRWVGFDCGHVLDRPEPGYAPPEFEALFAGGHLWTTDEVMAEVVRLAAHAAAATGWQP